MLCRRTKRNTCARERANEQTCRRVLDIPARTKHRFCRRTASASYKLSGLLPNENKMSDGGRDSASFGLGVWESSQKWSVQRSAVRSIAWLDVLCAVKSRPNILRPLERFSLFRDVLPARGGPT